MTWKHSHGNIIRSWTTTTIMALMNMPTYLPMRDIFIFQSSVEEIKKEPILFFLGSASIASMSILIGGNS